MVPFPIPKPKKKILKERVVKSNNKHCYNMKMTTSWVIDICRISFAVVQERVVTDNSLHNPCSLCCSLEVELTGRVSDKKGLHVIIDVPQIDFCGWLSFYK